MSFQVLAPAAQDEQYTIIIKKEHVPYLESFYQANKLEGESKEQYLVRILILRAKDELLKDYHAQLQADMDAIEAQKISDLEAKNAEAEQVYAAISSLTDTQGS